MKSLHSSLQWKCNSSNGWKAWVLAFLDILFVSVCWHSLYIYIHQRFITHIRGHPKCNFSCILLRIICCLCFDFSFLPLAFWTTEGLWSSVFTAPTIWSLPGLPWVGTCHLFGVKLSAAFSLRCIFLKIKYLEWIMEERLRL